MNRILFAWVLCALAWPVLADDDARANRLMVEAVSLIQASEREPSAAGKFRFLKEAHDNLVEIVDQHPSSDLAVRLATGQAVGSVSLSGVREAMERARIAEPAKPGAPIHVWRNGSAVVEVAFSSTGDGWVLIASRGGVVAVHDARTGALLGTWQHGPQMSAALSPDGRHVLTASRDGVVALRDAPTGRVQVEWRHRRAVGAVALARDTGFALVGSGRAALLVDTRTVQIRHDWRHGSPVTSVAYSPDGRWILAGYADGTALLGNARTGRTIHQWKHPGSGGGGVTSASFSPDGARVLTGAANRRAVLHDIATGRIVHEWKTGARVKAVAYSGRWVLTGDDDYEVELHDARTGRTLRKWRYRAPPTAVAFSPGDRGALMGFSDGTVILCDIRLREGRRGYERTSLTPDGGCW